MTVEYCMARGFESKDVEYQQAERESAADRRPDDCATSSAELRAGALAIELSLTRMRADLTKAAPLLIGR